MDLKFLGGGKMGDGSSMGKMIEELLEEAVTKEKVVVKTFPIKKEWLKHIKKGEADIKALREKEKEIRDDAERLWSIIRLDSNSFNTSLRFSEDRKFIEVLEDKDKAPGVKSPFV